MLSFWRFLVSFFVCVIGTATHKRHLADNFYGDDYRVHNLSVKGTLIRSPKRNKNIVAWELSEAIYIKKKGEQCISNTSELLGGNRVAF